VFFTCQVLAFVERAIGPAFLAVAVLQVVFPLALVPRSVYMDVDTVPVGLVVDPVALVDVTVNVNELALAVGSVVLPITFVASAVRPDLLSKSISEATDPLAIISSASFEFVCSSLLPLGVRVVDGVRYCFSLFIYCKVSAVSALCLVDERNLLTCAVTSPESLNFDY
jgi:hypothetical protein